MSRPVRVIAWLRRDHGSAPDALLIALAVVLVRLPVALGILYAWPLRLLTLVPFMLSAVRNLVRIARGSAARVHGSSMLLLAAYIGLVSISHLRALLDLRMSFPVTSDSGLVFLTVAVTAVLAFVAARSPGQQEQLRVAVVVGLVVYLGVNLGLYLAGARHPEVLYHKELPASMLEFLGIRAPAALFPMAGGINAFGVIGGGVAAMSGAILVRRARRRGVVLLAVLGLALGLVTLAWTDGRLSLVFSLLTIFLIAIAGDRRAPALRWAVVIPVLLPPVLIACLLTIPAGWWESLGDAARQAASLSNREAVWREVLTALLAFKPLHLVGFGAYGQLASGLSAAYSPHFSAYVHGDLAGGHNAFLQTVIEMGYLGAGILLAMLVVGLGRLTHRDGSAAAPEGVQALLSFLVFLVLAGSVEACWSTEQQELQAALLLTLAAASVSPWQTDTGQERI